MSTAPRQITYYHVPRMKFNTMVNATSDTESDLAPDMDFPRRPISTLVEPTIELRPEWEISPSQQLVLDRFNQLFTQMHKEMNNVWSKRQSSELGFPYFASLDKVAGLLRYQINSLHTRHLTFLDDGKVEESLLNATESLREVRNSVQIYLESLEETGVDRETLSAAAEKDAMQLGYDMNHLTMIFIDKLSENWPSAIVGQQIHWAVKRISVKGFVRNQIRMRRRIKF